MHPRMVDQLGVMLLLQSRDQLFHFIGVSLVGQQQGIRRIHYQQVVQPQSRNQAITSHKQGVVTVQSRDFALYATAIGGGRKLLLNGRPAAQILPACVQRCQVADGGMLQQSVVDGDGGAVAKSLVAHPDKVQIGTALLPCVATGQYQFGLQGLQRIQQRICTAQQQARVPQSALLDQGSSPIGTWLFNKPAYRPRLCSVWQNVAVTRGGVIGRYSEQANLAGLCSRPRAVDRLLERCNGVDQLISRQGQQQLFRLSAIDRIQSRQHQTGRCVTALWLQHNAAAQAGFLQLLRQQEAMLFTADQ